MSVDPAVVSLVRTVADLLTRWADAHITPPLPPPDPAPRPGTTRST